MARYFKFKTGDELIACARELGHDLALSTDLAPLFQPLSLGSRKIGNRLVVQPMEGCDATNDGIPDELTYRRYDRFGRGGAKLIWGEAAAISLAARANPRQLVVQESSLPGLERMLRNCRSAHREEFGHDEDLLVGLQLTHSGRYAFGKPLIPMHDPLLDGRTFDPTTGRVIQPDDPILSDQQVEQIVEQFTTAASRVLQLGYDFIDLKQCHRYLLCEFLSARSRPGPYGGSYEHRTRLIREIVTRIRQEHPTALIATRLNVYDGLPHRKRAEDGIGEPAPHHLPVTSLWGCDPQQPDREDLSEPIRLVRDLQAWGVGLINVTVGNPYANPHILRPADYPPLDGYLPPEHPLLGVLRHFRVAAAIQAAAPDLPVIGSGYSWLQEFAGQAAAANVCSGAVQLAGFGRATLSHPDFAIALERDGRFDRKRICRTFSYCTGLMRSKQHPLGQYPAGCPPFDKAAYGEVWKQAEAQWQATSRQLSADASAAASGEDSPAH